MQKAARVGPDLVRIASLYMVLGLSVGMFVGITKRMEFASVHSHAALVGWATMGITGLTYVALPRCAESRLARLHFWLHNAGLPLMVGGLALLATGRASAEPAVGLGSALDLLGLAAFAVNVLRNASPASGA